MYLPPEIWNMILLYVSNLPKCKRVSKMHKQISDRIFKSYMNKCNKKYIKWNQYPKLHTYYANKAAIDEDFDFLYVIANYSSNIVVACCHRFNKFDICDYIINKHGVYTGGDRDAYKIYLFHLWRMNHPTRREYTNITLNLFGNEIHTDTFIGYIHPNMRDYINSDSYKDKYNIRSSPLISMKSKYERENKIVSEYGNNTIPINIILITEGIAPKCNRDSNKYEFYTLDDMRQMIVKKIYPKGEFPMIFNEFLWLNYRSYYEDIFRYYNIDIYSNMITYEKYNPYILIPIHVCDRNTFPALPVSVFNNL